MFTTVKVAAETVSADEIEIRIVLSIFINKPLPAYRNYYSNGIKFQFFKETEVLAHDVFGSMVRNLDLIQIALSQPGAGG